MVSNTIVWLFLLFLWISIPVFFFVREYLLGSPRRLRKMVDEEMFKHLMTFPQIERNNVLSINLNMINHIKKREAYMRLHNMYQPVELEPNFKLRLVK